MRTVRKIRRSDRNETSRRSSRASRYSSTLSSLTRRINRSIRTRRMRPRAFTLTSRLMISTGMDEGASTQNLRDGGGGFAVALGHQSKSTYQPLRYLREISFLSVIHLPSRESKMAVINVRKISRRSTIDIETSSRHMNPMADASKHTRNGTVIAEYMMSTRIMRSPEEKGLGR